MDVTFKQSVSQKYHSQSQIVRILTETWMGENIYCPHCGSLQLNHFPNNQAVADFYCPRCRCEYELKSKRGAIGNKIADGAYETFIQRITSNNNPDFFILSYDTEVSHVENLWLIPKHFFVPDIVEKRKPLSETAQRAGWVGCNILFEKIPKQGQIEIIKDSCPVEKSVVMSKLRRASALRIDNIETRGWLLDVLTCVNQIKGTIITLEQMYAFEEILQKKHPENHNIRPKIRQQLQVLRDNGFLEFQDRGIYKKLG